MGGSQASAVFTFSRAGHIVMASIGAGAASTAAAAAAAAPRGAGSVAVPSSSQQPSPSPANVVYYRQYQERCGMLVPVEIEAAATGGGDAAGNSYAHFDAVALSAWESLEGAPPPG